MATFVLVHGAWHGGWCYKRVRLLRQVLKVYSRGAHSALAIVASMHARRTGPRIKLH